MKIQFIIFYFEKIKGNISTYKEKFFSNDLGPLFKQTKFVYSLTNRIRENNLNNITASSISYSYKIEEDELHIIIDIDEISKKISKYKIYQLGNEKNTEIKIEYGNYTISNPSISKDNEFTVFDFDLPNVFFSNLKVCITQKIKNLNQKSNLYFIPRNYLKNVKFIKIYHNSKPVKCYRVLPNNNYENVVTLDYSKDEEYVCLNNKNDPSYVNSVFFISDYKSN